MNKNVIQTKKKLTIIFTTIVFFVILFSWTSFFTFKYFNDIRIEKTWFISVINTLESGKISVENFIKMSTSFQNSKLTESNNNKERKISRWNLNPRGFVNHIFIEKTDIISSNIKDNVDENFLFSILENDKNNLYKEQGFLVKKIKSWNKNLIIFKKLRYDFSDYIYDLLFFIFINICFSVILYFIWWKFVNKAFVPVEENMKDMNDFVQNAGHEFKTPLSVIDSNIQLIKDIKQYNPEMLDEIKEESLKLNSLIESLIKLTNIDSIQTTQDINLESIIQELRYNFKSQIDDKKLSFNINIDKNIIINADKSYLYILLSNLIWNSIKYNKTNGDIDIIYKNNSLIISDTWIGIDKIEINKIFDRFYKVDTSRNSIWFGIWLSLVIKIANIYNWNISVESEINKWSSFIINF